MPAQYELFTPAARRGHQSLSPTAARLLAGTAAEPFLDRAAPRSAHLAEQLGRG